MQNLSKNTTAALDATSPATIKAYFQNVRQLHKSGEEFPVNLDEVWPLVYGRKEEAVRALKSDFIESIDYQVLRKNAENPQGGSFNVK